MTEKTPQTRADDAAQLAQVTSADGEDAEIEEGLEEAEIAPQRLVREIRAVLEGYSGPLPHPSILAHYREVDPRSLDWVFESATKEQEHRHWCEKEPLRQSGRAQLLAFSLGVVVVLIGASLIFADKPAAGLATILVPLATLLAIFVYREVRSHESSAEAEERN